MDALIPTTKQPIPNNPKWETFRQFVAKYQNAKKTYVIPAYLQQRYEKLYTRGDPRYSINNKRNFKPKPKSKAPSQPQWKSRRQPLINVNVHPIVRKCREILGKISNSNYHKIAQQLNSYLQTVDVSEELAKQISDMMFTYICNCLYLKQAIVSVFISLQGIAYLQSHLLEKIRLSSDVSILIEWYNQQAIAVVDILSQKEAQLYESIKNSQPPHTPYYQPWISILEQIQLTSETSPLKEQLHNHLQEFYNYVENHQDNYRFKDIFMLEELLEKFRKLEKC